MAKIPRKRHAVRINGVKLGALWGSFAITSTCSGLLCSRNADLHCRASYKDVPNRQLTRSISSQLFFDRWNLIFDISLLLCNIERSGAGY
jgi:hypothetical protein